MLTRRIGIVVDGRPFAGVATRWSPVTSNTFFYRRSSTNTSGSSGNSDNSITTIGIRREQKGKWERRAPLTPQAVAELHQTTGIRFLVQPCNKRVFSPEEYAKAGATITDDLSPAQLIMGIKEVPVESMLNDRRFMYFSHTHKGQRHNLPALKAVLEKRITLMDYELLVNEKHQRLVAFGRHAGYAGMIEILHGLGLRLLNLGYGTPFATVPRPYSFRLLEHAKRHLQDVNERITAAGLPKAYSPMVFTFTGDGNVSQGAQEIFRCLPHEWLAVKELHQRWSTLSNHKVYGVLARPQDYLRNEGGRFDMQDYLKHGSDKYRSVFASEVLPYTSVLVNGAYWDERYPKLIVNDDLHLLEKAGQNRLLAVADVSCDISGPLEFMDHASTIDEPFFMFDPATRTQHQKMDGPGFIICSIDNLPAELAHEATLHFSHHLKPLVKDLAEGKKNAVLDGAVIAANGELVGKHRALNKLVATAHSAQSKKRVLLLGSGRVAAPLVDYLMRSPDMKMTIASNNLDEARALTRGHSACAVHSLNVDDADGLRKLIAEHDLAISFVPASLHPKVAAACLDAKRNMLTASYKSPELEAMDDRFKAAGLVLLNELGLDPGIDHLLAVQFIDKVKSEGGKITDFVSNCGGLPAPECSNNPLGYKFSWSPRGVLTAAMNPAQYMMAGQITKVDPGKILDVAKEVTTYKGFNLEVLPNRDSLKYIDLYGLQRTDLRTMFRGTLRYRGFSEVMRIFRDLGFFDAAGEVPAKNWHAYLKRVFDTQHPRDALAKHLADHSPEAQRRVIRAFEWFGMFDDATQIVGKSPMDALCALLESRLKYEPDERDLVVLYHEFGVLKKSGEREKHLISLVAYGNPRGYTAMSKTVALPAAMGAELILSGRLAGSSGALMPTKPQIYEPILSGLSKEGLVFGHTKQRLG